MRSTKNDPRSWEKELFGLIAQPGEHFVFGRIAAMIGGGGGSGLPVRPPNAETPFFELFIAGPGVGIAALLYLYEWQ